jgi:hypothetical protein
MWDFKFSRRRVWCSELSSGLYCRVTGRMVSFLAGYGNHLSTPLKHIESPPHRSNWYICPSQDNSVLRQTRCHFPITLIPSRSFNEALSRAKLHPLHILSLSLSLYYLNQPPTAIGRFPAYGHLYKPRSFRARLTHPWWWRQYAPLKRRSTIILHGSITQKTTLNKVYPVLTARQS